MTNHTENQQLSLEERILRIAATDNSDLPDFPDDKSDLPSDFEYNPEDYEDQEEEVIEEISENELLQYLDQQENPLFVAQRLFYHELNTTEYQKQSNTWDLHCLTPKVVEELYSKGWTEIEGIINLDILKDARKEAESLLEKDKFISAKEFIEDDSSRDMNVRNDSIVWLDPSNELNEKGFVETPPNFKQLLEFITGPIYHDLSKMIRLNGKMEHQLSYYHSDGAHYERHRDSFPTDNPDDISQRRVTVVFYLNPGWGSNDGGEVKIFSQNDDHGISEGASRIIKPLLGRVLIKLSGAVDYEILPTRKPIFALTSWIR